MGREFQRRVENFKCLKCSQYVEGDGYTNHCPACLHSRHVDMAPGDRSCECMGLMAPVAVQWGSPHKIVHRCESCGVEKKNRCSPADDFEALLQLSKSSAQKKVFGS